MTKLGLTFDWDIVEQLANVQRAEDIQYESAVFRIFLIISFLCIAFGQVLVYILGILRGFFQGSVNCLHRNIKW